MSLVSHMPEEYKIEANTVQRHASLSRAFDLHKAISMVIWKNDTCKLSYSYVLVFPLHSGLKLCEFDAFNS